MKKILVLCIGNSCRSQMLEGYLRYFLEEKSKEYLEKTPPQVLEQTFVYSAGIETHGVNPRAVAVMLEDEIDISAQVSTNVEEYKNEEFDFVITVCDDANRLCPVFPAKTARLHHPFADPALAEATGTEEEILSEFRKVRKMIKIFAEKFVKEL